AVYACLVAATLWGLYWIPLRYLENSGISGLWASLLIYVVAFFFVFPRFFKLRADFYTSKTLYILLAIFAGWTNLAFVLALLEGEVVRVMILFYLSPVWATLLAFFILNERLKKRNIMALVLAIAGVFLISWHPEIEFTKSFDRADFYAVTSGVAFAISNILVRKIGGLSHSVKMCSAWFGVMVLAGCGILLTQDSFPVVTLNNLLLIFVLGFPLMIIMTWTAQYAVSNLPIYLSSVLFLFEIIVGAISAVMLANEFITIIQFIGIIMILSAGLINTVTTKIN
ncbi:MAG: DMT family transporter, partial [Candidatus Marinimicrobia bacterium]|nr:DMT family transporter [Candidatus Neomarinimicrobiota bacterium]